MVRILRHFVDSVMGPLRKNSIPRGRGEKEACSALVRVASVSRNLYFRIILDCEMGRVCTNDVWRHLAPLDAFSNWSYAQVRQFHETGELESSSIEGYEAWTLIEIRDQSDPSCPLTEEQARLVSLLETRAINYNPSAKEPTC